jgi:hypothetical protein
MNPTQGLGPLGVSTSGHRLPAAEVRLNDSGPLHGPGSGHPDVQAREEASAEGPPGPVSPDDTDAQRGVFHQPLPTCSSDLVLHLLRKAVEDQPTVQTPRLMGLAYGRYQEQSKGQAPRAQ